MNLYELTGQLLELEQMIEEGAYDDDTLLDTWESIDAVFEDKADGYAMIMRNMAGTIETIKGEEQRLRERRKALEHGIDRLKASLQHSMNLVDKRKFKTDLFSFNIQRNPAKVVIDDEEAIPDGFWVEQAPQLDKNAISVELKAGNQVKGAHLEQGESLRIR